MEKNNYKITAYNNSDSKNNNTNDEYEKEENSFEDAEKKLIGSVYDEITFRNNLDKIISRFLRTLPEFMNGTQEENKELYRKYHFEVIERYHEKISNRIKAKALDNRKIIFDPFDLKQFSNDIEEILKHINLVFNSAGEKNKVVISESYTEDLIQRILSKIKQLILPTFTSLSNNMRASHKLPSVQENDINKTIPENLFDKEAIGIINKIDARLLKMKEDGMQGIPTKGKKLVQLEFLNKYQDPKEVGKNQTYYKGLNRKELLEIIFPLLSSIKDDISSKNWINMFSKY